MQAAGMAMLLVLPLHRSAAADLTSQTVDLGTWETLNPYVTVTSLRTQALAEHRGRIYIGHEAANAQPNAAVYFDTALNQFAADRTSNNAIVQINNELVTRGVVKQGDLLWIGEDNAIGTNESSLYVRRHDGWREYYSPGANPHRQGGYIFEGKIFLSNYHRSKPGASISYDGGATRVEINQSSSVAGADFPAAASYLTYSFFEFEGELFALQWTLGTPVSAGAWMVHYTRDPAAPWELVHRDPTVFGLHSYPLDYNSTQFKGYWFTSEVAPTNPYTANVYRLFRFGSETVTGRTNTYKRPAAPTIVATRTQATATRNGYFYRVDISGDLNQLALHRTADGVNWTELCTLNISSTSPLAYFKARQAGNSDLGRTRLVVTATDIYIGIGTRLFKVPGSALGSLAPNGSANTAPVAVNDSFTLLANTSRSVDDAFLGLLANDTDADQDAFYATLTTGPTHGALTLRYNGTYTYTPTAGYSGTDSFTYTISDGYGSSTATVNITVQPNATPPPAANRFVVKPTSVTATQISTGASNWHNEFTVPLFTINGSGLSATLDTSAPVPATPGTVTASGAGGVLWLSADLALNDQRLTYDLGASYLLTDLLLWNQTETGTVTRRGVRTANIAVSTDGLNYTSLGAFTFATGSGNPIPMQTASFAAPVSARYVRFDPTQNYANFNNDGSGDRRYSFNEIRLVARPPLVIPAAPAALAATAVSASRIDLTWTDNSSNETGFALERSSDGVTFAALVAPAANATGYSDTELVANTAYFYRLRAVGTDGNSSYTAIASATTAPDFASWSAALPAGLRAAADVPYGDGVANLIRYALGLDPARAVTATERAELPALGASEGGGPGELRFGFTLPDAAPEDVSYVIETTSVLGAGSWTVLASKTGRGAWAGSTAVTVDGPVAGRVRASVALGVPPARVFLRVRVETVAP